VLLSAPLWPDDPLAAKDWRQRHGLVTLDEAHAMMNEHVRIALIAAKSHDVATSNRITRALAEFDRALDNREHWVTAASEFITSVRAAIGDQS
jgi:hypothetical protein